MGFLGEIWSSGVKGRRDDREEKGEVRRLRSDGEQGGSIARVCDCQLLVLVAIRALPGLLVDVECSEPWVGKGYLSDRD